jgi:hypothetical protein
VIGIKVLNQLNAGLYTVIQVDKKTNFGNFAIIENKEYETEITYDLPNSIAIKAVGNFVGKEIMFHN